MFALSSCVLLVKVCYAYWVFDNAAEATDTSVSLDTFTSTIHLDKDNTTTQGSHMIDDSKVTRPKAALSNTHEDSTPSQGQHNYTRQTHIYALNITRPKAALSNTSQA